MLVRVRRGLVVSMPVGKSSWDDLRTIFAKALVHDRVAIAVYDRTDLLGTFRHGPAEDADVAHALSMSWHVVDDERDDDFPFACWGELEDFARELLLKRKWNEFASDWIEVVFFALEVFLDGFQEGWELLLKHGDLGPAFLFRRIFVENGVDGFFPLLR